MSSSSVAPDSAALPVWEREALKDTTWRIEKPLEKFTEEEAISIITNRGGIMLTDDDPAIPSHTLATSESTYYVLSGDNKKASIFEPGFISYIRSNAIGKRMNYAELQCLNGFTFLVVGRKLPWLTLKEARSVVEESGGTLLKKGRGEKVTVGARVDWIIVGEGASEEDIEKAKGLGVGVIDEQGLFDVIHDKDEMRTRRKKARQKDEEKDEENKENEPQEERKQPKEEEGESSKGKVGEDKDKGMKKPTTASTKRKGKPTGTEIDKEAENPPVKKRELRSSSKKAQA